MTGKEKTDMDFEKIMQERSMGQQEGKKPGPEASEELRKLPVETAESYDPYPGRTGAIGEKQIGSAWQTLLDYKNDRTVFTERIKENWEYFENSVTSGRLRDRARRGEYRKSSSAYLFNSIANKHADFMDNMPAPAILPREESDQEVSGALSDVIPCIHDLNDFEKIYSEGTYNKLIGGTGVYGVFWNGQKENGLGDIELKEVDIMNLYWESGIEDIQKSKNLFYVTIADNETVEEQYPFLKGKIGNSTDFIDAKYFYETQVDTSKYTALIDWYYKKRVMVQNGIGEQIVKEVLHYCKFIPGEVIFASENMPEQYRGGWYDHGLYPFVFDPLFPLKGSPAGFGYVDVMKNPQEYIDTIDDAIRENAELKAQPRYFNLKGSAINRTQFLDKKERLIDVQGNVDAVRPVETPDLPGVCLDVRTLKVDELKETSGNRDFSQGTTSGGVTAASAIAALQEAGSKLSRDMIKGSYNAYRNVIHQEIELIRQFYSIKRFFRVTRPNEEYEFIQFDNRAMQPDPEVNEFGQVLAGRTPFFDIKISAQKASPYARITQNELAKELYSAGMFNPQMADQAILCIGMMDFDGKDEILQKINRNYTLYAQNMQMQAQIAELASVAAEMTGDPQTAALAGAVAEKEGQAEAIPTGRMKRGSREVDSLGGSRESGNPKADRAKKQAAKRSEVK